MCSLLVGVILCRDILPPPVMKLQVQDDWSEKHIGKSIKKTPMRKDAS